MPEWVAWLEQKYQSAWIYISIHIYLYSIYFILYIHLCMGRERERCQGEIIDRTYPAMLNQTLKIQGQAMNSLIQLGIALEWRDELPLLTVLECPCEVEGWFTQITRVTSQRNWLDPNSWQCLLWSLKMRQLKKNVHKNIYLILNMPNKVSNVF